MFFQIFPLFGILGTLIIVLGIATSALRYQGKQGEHFSLLNHFISELGEVGVSRSAGLFNLGMILGGLILVPYMIGLGFRFASLTGWLGSAAGVVATLAVAAVGIFPVNNLPAHVRAAMTYFRSGLIMVFFLRAGDPVPACRTSSHPPDRKHAQCAGFFTVCGLPVPVWQKVCSEPGRSARPANGIGKTQDLINDHPGVGYVFYDHPVVVWNGCNHLGPDPQN